MQITIFGANGKVGRLVVEEALEKGYEVVAFCHGKADFAANHNLRLVYGDVYSADDVDNALKGSGAVISTLGSWGTPNKDILTMGMKSIIPAMQKHKIEQIISLTGADAVVGSSRVSKLSRMFFGLVAGKIIQDGYKHIQLLKNSDLDWTVVLSPVMSKKGSPSNFILTAVKPMPWATINRTSVARSLVDLVNDRSHLKQAPYIKRL